MKKCLSLLCVFACSNVWSYNSTIDDLLTVASTKENVCQLNHHCEDNQNPLLSKYLLASGLAEEVVENVLDTQHIRDRSNYYANVVVSSTGFDSDNYNDSTKVVVKTTKGIDKAFNAHTDQIGDGTQMIGVIAGKKIGVTKHINLESQALTSQHDQFINLSHQEEDEAIINACKNADVVAISWLQLDLAVGHKKLLEKKWYKYAYENGCLLVISSGLYSVHSKKDWTLPIASPIITTSQRDYQNNSSVFDIDSMIYTPTLGNFTFLNKVNNKSIDTINSCLYENIALEKSFRKHNSSAATAAVAGQVITILKARNLLPANPKTRLSVVKKILLIASQYEKSLGKKESSLNAYIATLIAKNVNESDFTLGSNQYLEALTDVKNQICNEDHNSCEQIDECNLKVACVNKIREKAILCQESSFNLNFELSNILTDINEPTLSWYTYKKSVDFSINLNLQNNKAKKIQEDYVRFLWEKTQSNNKKFLIVDRMAEVMLLAKKLDLAGFHTVDNFLRIMNEHSLFFFSVYEERLKDPYPNEMIRNGQLIANLYLSFNSSERSQIVNFLETSYSQGSFDQNLLQFTMQLNSAEGLFTDIGSRLSNLLTSITVDSIEIENINQLKISKYDYEYLLTKLPKAKEIVKSKLTRPFISINPEVIKLAFEYDKIFFDKSKYEVAKEMLYELMDYENEIMNEVQDAKSSLIDTGKYYNFAKTYSSTIAINLMFSKVIEPEVVELFKRMMMLKLPLYFAGAVSPQYKSVFSDPLFRNAVYEKQGFLNEYLSQQIELLNDSIELKTFVDPSEFNNYANNIAGILRFNSSNLNRIDEKISPKFKQKILSTFDIAVNRLKILKEQPKYAPYFQKGMDYQLFYKWKMAGEVAEQALVTFIKLSLELDEIDSLKGISSELISKIKNLNDLFQNGKLDLKEKTVNLIKKTLK